MVGVQARTEQARYAIDRGLSQRKACTLLGISRSNLTYTALLPGKDLPIVGLMLELSSRYPRFGYRRIRIFLERAGYRLSNERCARLWAKAGLQVPGKRTRKAVTNRLRPAVPSASLGYGVTILSMMPVPTGRH